MNLRNISWRLSAIALVAILAIGGVSAIYQSYSALQGSAAMFQMTQFRAGVTIVRELGRLGASIDLLDNGAENQQQALADFEQSVDFLYVQAQPFRNAIANTESSEAADNLDVRLQSIVDFADLILSDGMQERDGYEAQFRMLLNAAMQHALTFVDEQFHVKADLITQKERLLAFVTFLSIGLTILFSVIALAAVWLFERELRASKQRKVAEKKVAYLAHFDGMTGLPKRARFRAEGRRILRRAERSLVMLIDVDDFKNVNDTYGHAVGDSVLCHVATILKNVVGKRGGAVARLGGDEFAAIIPGPISSMRASAICEQLISAINTPMEHDNIQISQHVSVGVAISHTDEAPEVDDMLADLMKSADVALYQSKDEGKNTYAFYDSHLADVVARRRNIEKGLSETIANGGFHLNFQPQVDMKDGKIIGFEALARWNWQGDRISPGEFIPIAEDSGQVVEIDYFCLRDAARTLKRWIDGGLPPVKISTNLSAVHFRDERIIDVVADVLRETDLPPHLLTLEVTESVMIQSVQSVVSILECLKQLGVTIALDDFGTGYSSLAYLRMLPVDFIKIDQSFVRDLEDSLETQIVMQSLVGLIQGLNRSIVVEGIESSLQSAMIRQMGCEYGQGYFYGRPLDAKDAYNALTENADSASRIA